MSRESAVSVGRAGCGLRFEQRTEGWPGSKFTRYTLALDVRRVMGDGPGDEVQIGVAIYELKGERMFEHHASMTLDAASAAQLAKAILELDPNSGGEKTKTEIARRAGIKPTRRQRVQRQVDDQRQWIQSCGGDLAGYVANYGDPGLARCYGNGGTAIYEADAAELRRLEALLEATS